MPPSGKQDSVLSGYRRGVPVAKKKGTDPRESEHFMPTANAHSPPAEPGAEDSLGWSRTIVRQFVLVLILSWWGVAPVGAGEEPLRIAVFNVSATPPIGSPVAYAPARKIEDPLSARGIVLLTGAKPIVLCAVDWIGIANGGNDVWRRQLAEAAGTMPDRVAVHTLHQHDGPRCDFDAEELLAARGLGGKFYDAAFARDTIRRTAAAIRDSLRHACRVTHVGAGKAKVSRFASNRRILGPDGKVKINRGSSCRQPDAINAPEGVIDPYVQLISFWDHERPVACLSYYATHPQSYYGNGDVTADTVGLARAIREQAVPGVAFIHFNGAGGNVGAGKYNDGSPPMRLKLAERLAAGMKAAWEATVRRPIAAGDVDWAVHPTRLPLRHDFDAVRLRAKLDDSSADATQRLWAANDLAWVNRCLAGHAIDIARLRLGNLFVLHMPGELFVEYQLAAQQMRLRDTVCMAAYGDYGASYIGTRIAYAQNGYEDKESHVAPEVEVVLMGAMRELLK